MRRSSWWIMLVLTMAATPDVAPAVGVRYELGPKGLVIEGVDTTCPMIYDNDWWADVPDQYYLWAKASLGKAELRGNIVTRDLWNWKKGYHFTLSAGVKDAQAALDRAKRSGMRNIPQPVPGSNRGFRRPASGKIEDTVAEPSKGSDLIVTEARKASAKKPLLVFVGGPLNTVANAYLKDPAIANRMVVFMTDIHGYNGQDPWANYIVASRCKVVNFGARLWWPQRPKTPMLPPDRCKRLPANEVTKDIHRLAEEFWKRSTRAKPDRDDGMGDGGPIFLVFKPTSWTKVRRQRIKRVFEFEEVTNAPYDILDARVCDFSAMREDFFATVGDAKVYHPTGK